MALFGFLAGSSSARFQELTAYGEAQARSGGLSAPGTRLVAADSCACWGPALANENGVTVLLSGSASLGGAHASTAAAPAAAILQGYRRVGDRILDGLSGRFALAIIEPGRCRALLAVDPMGIERLTFARCGDGLVFGSSAEGVARFPLLNAPLNHQALFDYLLLHMVPAPDTVFAGVSKLRAGTCAIFESGDVRVQRYWHPQFTTSGGERFETLKEALHASLRSAVRAAQPDAETGAFLSGGLDSSSVAGVLSEVAPGAAQTFSIGFTYPQYDERSYARIANARFGCRGHEYVVQGTDIVETFGQIARVYDEPFGNSSALPVYYCARLARDHGVRHLLAGDGGDELFAGNSRYAEQQIFERYQLLPALLRKRILEPLVARWPDSLLIWPVRKARGYLAKANTPLPTRLEAWNVVTELGAAQFLHPDFLPSVDPRLPFRRMHEVWDAADTANTVQRMLFYDWQYTLADNDLRKVESMTALAGVRVSYPMLNPEVVAMSLRVPPQIMMPGMQLRHFYKRATQGWLPQEIIDKKKHGFGLPFGLWLRDCPPLSELIFGNLSALRARRVVHPQVIDRLLDLHRSEDASHYGVFLWVLAMLEQWFQEHRVTPAV
jgi:asparagine synthase (glutamine-hydrolysing)